MREADLSRAVRVQATREIRDYIRSAEFIAIMRDQHGYDLPHDDSRAYLRVTDIPDSGTSVSLSGTSFSTSWSHMFDIGRLTKATSGFITLEKGRPLSCTGVIQPQASTNGTFYFNFGLAQRGSGDTPVFAANPHAYGAGTESRPNTSGGAVLSVPNILITPEALEEEYGEFGKSLLSAGELEVGFYVFLTGAGSATYLHSSGGVPVGLTALEVG